MQAERCLCFTTGFPWFLGSVGCPLPCFLLRVSGGFKPPSEALHGQGRGWLSGVSASPDNVKISPNGSVITISQARTSNQGTYHCVASNRFGIASSVVNLMVQGEQWLRKPGAQLTAPETPQSVPACPSLTPPSPQSPPRFP